MAKYFVIEVSEYVRRYLVDAETPDAARRSVDNGQGPDDFETYSEDWGDDVQAVGVYEATPGGSEYFDMGRTLWESPYLKPLIRGRVSALLMATLDWGANVAYLDGAGNYRHKSHPRTVYWWNREVKRLLGPQHNRELHRLAQLIVKGTPIA